MPATLLLCALLLAAPNLTGGLVLFDPFHHGEFFASAVSFFSARPQNFLPLTIHGALDYIPALTARAIWGANNYFLPTWALYKLLNVLAAFALFAIAFRLTRDKPHRWELLLAAAAAAPFLVGYRDLLLLVCLYLFVHSQTAPLNPRIQPAFLAIFGILVGAGLFWSFDRGIAGTVSLGTSVLILSYRKPIYLVSIAGFAVALLIFGNFFQVFAFHNYVENVKILIQTSSQWNLGWNTHTVLLISFAAMMNSLSISLLGYSFFRDARTIERVAFYAALLILSAAMFKIGINRAALDHIYWGLWVPMLSAFSVYGTGLEFPKPVKLLGIVVLGMAIMLTVFSQSVGATLVAATIAAAIFRLSPKKTFLPVNRLTSALILAAVAFPLYSTAKGISDGEYAWLKNIASPPTNGMSAPAAIRSVSEELLQAKANCVFDLSNNGEINGLTNLPSCSRFVYPVYAGPMHQNELIDTVRASSPKAIVYSSNVVSYAIDGKSMRYRFPELDRYLVSRYPRETCSEGYCVRYLRN